MQSLTGKLWWSHPWTQSDLASPCLVTIPLKERDTKHIHSWDRQPKHEKNEWNACKIFSHWELLLFCYISEDFLPSQPTTKLNHNQSIFLFLTLHIHTEENSSAQEIQSFWPLLWLCFVTERLDSALPRLSGGGWQDGDLSLWVLEQL